MADSVWYPSVEDIVAIHDDIVSEYPDTPSGTQNRGDIEFALDYIEEGTFSSAPETIHKKAFHLLRLLVANHPFVDANKRTALNAAVVFYFFNGYRFEYDDEIRSLVNYPVLLAPFRLAAVVHSSRAGLSRNAIVPRGPLRGRGPAFSCRSTVEAAGRSSAATRACRTRTVDCPAGLIPGGLALYPQTGNGSRTRSRSSSPSVGCEAVRPRTTDAGLLAASTDPDVCEDGSKSMDGSRGKTGRLAMNVNGDGRSSPPCRSLRSRPRKEAPRPAPLPLKDAHELSNLVTLCKWCHPKADHGKLGFESGVEPP